MVSDRAATANPNPNEISSSTAQDADRANPNSDGLRRTTIDYPSASVSIATSM